MVKIDLITGFLGSRKDDIYPELCASICMGTGD